MEANTGDENIKRIKTPIPLVCPVCKGLLTDDNKKIKCILCKKVYSYTNNFPDLVVGEKFEDKSSDELLKYEERSNRDLTTNYTIPRFNDLWKKKDETKDILSLGCGTGVDVDMLCDHGYNCVGIDCGNRHTMWERRKNKDRLYLANGKNLPFANNTFDGIFCGCVFPHVGVVGDSYRVTHNYYEERIELAKEMSRVLKVGGKMLVSSPNRLFPFDIFHGRETGSYKPRPYWPGDPFLLSLSDYKKLFKEAGCQSITAHPVENYWGFIRSKSSFTGYLFGLPVRLVFWMVSKQGLRFLCGTPINPWIVVLIEKKGVI